MSDKAIQNVSFRGSVAMTNIADLIQFLHASGKTGELMLCGRIGDETAHVFFADGLVVHATDGNRVGLDALVTLLPWNDGEFRFMPDVSAPVTTIALPAQQALMEAMRLKDEADRFADPESLAGFQYDTGSKPEPGNKPNGGPLMNTKKLTTAIDGFRERLGTGLVACDIYSADGLSLAGFNSNPAAVALFGEMTTRVVRSLSDAGFPNLGRYYLLELTDKKIVCVMNYREYQWGSLVDLEKVNMGMLISIAIPKAIEDLRAAIDG